MRSTSKLRARVARGELSAMEALDRVVKTRLRAGGPKTRLETKLDRRIEIMREFGLNPLLRRRVR